MPSLNKKQSVLIACRAMNPFTSRDLLRRVDGEVVPIPNAEDIRIRDLLIGLKAQDDEFDLHVIPTIRRDIIEQCDELGFEVAIGSGGLGSGRYGTIGALASHLRRSSS